MSTNLENRVIAYLDILGFKQLWESNPETAIEILKNIRDQNRHNTHFPEIEVSSFSDNIIISFLVSDQMTDEDFSSLLCSLMARISSFYLYNLQYGVTLRGAISIGKTYYDTNEVGKIIAGLPMHEAVDNEKFIAINPRVIISDSLLKKINTLQTIDRKVIFTTAVKMDFDGIFFVDYFSLSTTKEENEIFNLYSIVREQLATQLTKHIDNLKILSKWRWMANYFDTSVDIWNSKYPHMSLKKFGSFQTYLLSN